MACKWTFRSTIKLSGNSSLSELVQFYLWETPVPDTSQKGKPFFEYGWSKGSFLTLQAQMLKNGSLNKDKWIKTTAADINNVLNSMNRLNSFDCSFEFAVHTVKDKSNKTEALFYLIRNGFAHGGFRINKYQSEIYYVFESCDKGKLKGRAILKESTLKNWMEIVKRGHRCQH